jgi:hypothetical protein
VWATSNHVPSMLPFGKSLSVLMAMMRKHMDYMVAFLHTSLVDLLSREGCVDYAPVKGLAGGIHVVFILYGSNGFPSCFSSR